SGAMQAMKSSAHRKAAQAKAARTRETARGTRTAQMPRRLSPPPARIDMPHDAPAAEPLPERRLRVSTYNIHKGVLRDFTGLRRVARIHELRTRLHELDSDLIFLQEVQGQH